MSSSAFICIGFVVIMLVICICLLIFAPKSTNFYSHDTYPIIKYLHDNNLQIIKDDFSKIKNHDNWLEYPINAQGSCNIYPLYIFSILLEKRKQICANTYNLIKNIPDIKLCTFMILSSNSQINKNKGLKILCNNTLRCLIVLGSKNTTIDKCGIWVNGEQKKIKTNSLIFFDSSKEYTIYNKTLMDLEMLIIDIKRPEKIPYGISDRECDDKMKNFIYELHQENSNADE